MLLFLSTLSILTFLSSALCPDTTSCIARIREIVAGPRKFWFGEHRRALCHHRHSNPVDCYNPPHLAHFHSLGSRLFRAKTYHSAYLRNLEIFPRITYRAAPGEYRACDHDFHVRNVSMIEADPDMAPVAPFLIRKKPEIGWHGLQFDSNYTLLMTDVGFGTLNYLVTDFPRKHKTLKEYEPSENFRPQPNPMVLLVFRKGKTEIVPPKAENFNLGDFMIENELTDDLIGMSVVIVGSDPFAIERQRIRGVVDNCHSLIKKKIQRDSPSKLLPRLPLEETNTWLSISYEQNDLHASVCCQRLAILKSTLVLDPLGSPTISANSVMEPPRISALRVPQNIAYSNYHRTARTFVALMDELYTVVLIDGHTGKLHWMVIDVPASELADDIRGHGITKAEYLPPAPSEPAQCWPFIFALLAQSTRMPTVEKYCETDCRERKLFKFEEFKQRYALRLAALSWMSSCYDLPYAHQLLSKQASEIANSTVATPTQGTMRRSSVSSRRIRNESQRVCSAFNISPHHKCTISPMSASPRSTHYLVTLSLTLLVTVFTVLL